ncbi:hypothetical protein [Demequina flava]|uniref:hypothetical protein n=1 Tax=Demequina flava TaxID=1095025 RepID=UPI0007810A72|nr:hypothetical protein [Demequina flava]
MDAAIVFESMWGNTAAIAHAIASGYGDSARALTTDEATPGLVQTLALLVAGAPVHGLNLPTERSRATAAARNTDPDEIPADTTHPRLEMWLESLPAGHIAFAAFETRIAGPLGRGAATTIERHLRTLGYREIDRRHQFTVTMRPHTKKPAAMLLPGEEQKAFEWGIRLRKSVQAAP